MQHYDFILFENYQLATHHLYDVKLIATMLQSQGLSVAIFDLYNQFEQTDVVGIPIIRYESKNRIPDVSWIKRKHSKFESVANSIKFYVQRKLFLKEAKTFIQDKADKFYCGSLYNGMPTMFFDMQKPCYWWGLRSSRMKLEFKDFVKTPLAAFCKLKERHKFINNSNQRLFVSNSIIHDEFVKLGISSNRIVIREERCIDSKGDFHLEEMSDKMSFLVIGMLRSDKNIHLTVDAFKRADISDSKLYLIGRSSVGYEKEIKTAVGDDKRIKRVNKYLEYSDFNNYFRNSHFVLFADNEGPSCITNGTMMEALINYRPIICPNYQPYTYYVEKYGVGLLYDSSNPESYADALKKAIELGTNYFIDKIDKFLDTILFDKVSKEFVDTLKSNEIY